MSIHDQIKAARLAKKWSQGELAAKISEAEGLAKPLSWQTIQQWERPNGTAPKRERLAVVARLLDLDAATLTGIPAPTSSASHGREVTESQWAMLQDFDMLIEEDRSAIRKALKEKADYARRVFNELRQRHRVAEAPATNARVEEAFGAPPPTPAPAEGPYKKRMKVPPLTGGTPKKEGTS